MTELEVWIGLVISGLTGASAWYGVWDPRRRITVLKKMAKDLGRVAKEKEPLESAPSFPSRHPLLG